ncbi:hypothetical protein QEJ31_05855 [Pigmentibacter sp. JX0631]|uniref:hypothetical protein n=1 Tax=Pigmentibacter sp. JX0631 TaxID=2976982 RepID=UPI0024694BEA|nr:hypothetical protein [Pigmentibacter sp. JX0631]WGL61119.1 hypothetical protein QEJ31_05855 [Pigmentibacter sp. JX0631]
MNAKKIIKYISIMITPSIILINAFASEVNANYDLPLEKKEITVGKSKYSDSLIKRNCYKYSDYIVVEEVDGGQKGGALIRLEPTKNNVNILKVCKNKISDFKIKMVADGYYGGKINQFIINDGDDGFGSEFLFQIFAIKNNKLTKVFQDLRHDNQSYEYIKTSQNKLGVRYWKSLKVENDCLVKDTTCLDKIRVANKISTDLNFNNCIKSIEQRISTLKNEPYDVSYLNNTSGNQFFVYIEIPDIYSSKNYKILDKNVVCESKP